MEGTERIVKFLYMLVGHVGVTEEALPLTNNLMLALYYSHRLSSRRNE